MRRFSEYEKNTIKSILKCYEQSPFTYLLVNAYNDIFYQKRVKFTYDIKADQQCLVFYRNDRNTFNIEEAGAVENSILEVSLLLDYLQNEKLIYLIEPSAANTLYEISGFTIGDDDKEISVPLDSQIAATLFASMNHRIYIGETLKTLVADDFKTTDDKLLEETNQLAYQTMQLSRNAEEQIKEAQYQSEIAIAQHKEAQQLTEQAKQQTIEAHTQSEEAGTQSAEAKKQTKAALDQLTKAKKQTGLSLLAVVLSVIAIVCSICVAKFITMDVRMVDDQYKAINKEVSDIRTSIDSIMTHADDSEIMGKQTIDLNIVNLKK